MKESKENTKQEYEYVNQNGSTTKWVLPRPVEEVKKEIGFTLYNKPLNEIDFIKFINACIELKNEKIIEPSKTKMKNVEYKF